MLSKLMMMAVLASLCTGNIQLFGVYDQDQVMTQPQEPAPCSSEAFGRNGKCGLAANAFARCEQGLWCSQYGYCGSDYAYQVNSICPADTRPNPPFYEYVDDQVVPSNTSCTVVAAGNALATSAKPPRAISSKPPQAIRLSASKRQVDAARAKEADAASPLNCSSSKLHPDNRCGGADARLARCEQGFYCSQSGFCSSDPSYKVNPMCPTETRPNPEPYLYEFYTAVIEDAEILRRESNTTTPNCFMEAFHRSGKCGRKEHGYLRCAKGFWCSQHGYCGKGTEYQVNAICPEETRPNPNVYTYGMSPE